MLKVKTNNLKQKAILVALSTLFISSAVVLMPQEATAATSTAAATTSSYGLESLTKKSNNVFSLSLSKGYKEKVNFFTISDNTILVLDLPNGKNGLKKNEIKFAEGNLFQVKLVEVAEKTRVMFYLKNSDSYRLLDNGSGGLVLQLGSTAKTAPAKGFKVVSAAQVAPAVAVFNKEPEMAPAVAQPTPVVAAKAVDSNVVQLNKITFNREKNRVGVFGMEFSNPAANPVITKKGSTLWIEINNADIADTMQKKLQVANIGSITKTIDLYKQGNTVKIALEQAGDWEFSSYQTDKRFNVEIKPVSEFEAMDREDKAQKKYTGKPISLNFQSIEVGALLQVLSDFTKKNILASEKVQGKITVRLNNVPWDQALDLIMESKNLQKIVNNNVIWVATSAEVDEKQKQKITMKQQEDKLKPKVTEYFQVNHHKAADIAALLMPGVKVAGTTGVFTDAATGRSIGIDTRSNTLFITDFAENIREAKKTLKKFDVPVRQVLIDAKIVIADNKYARELGAKFGFGYKKTRGDYTVGVADNLNNTGALVGATSDTPILPLIYNNPAVGGGVMGLTILNNLTGNLLNVELSAMEGDDRGRIVSNPRILTTDNKEASIEQGTEVPYSTSSSDSGTTVEFKKAVMSLNVKPQIAPNGRVIMDINISKDSIGQYVPVQGGGTIPSIDTKKVETQVSVNDGQTVVLGGVLENITVDGLSKVPFLADIPAIGEFFKHKLKKDDKAELLIFITPRVITDDMVDAIDETPMGLELSGGGVNLIKPEIITQQEMELKRPTNPPRAKGWFE